MDEHRFDPVAFVIGCVAVAAGVVVLTGRSLTDDARILLPAGLIALGVSLLVRIVGGGHPSATGPSTRPEAGFAPDGYPRPEPEPGPDLEPDLHAEADDVPGPDDSAGLEPEADPPGSDPDRHPEIGR